MFTIPIYVFTLLRNAHFDLSGLEVDVDGGYVVAVRSTGPESLFIVTSTDVASPLDVQYGGGNPGPQVWQGTVGVRVTGTPLQQVPLPGWAALALAILAMAIAVGASRSTRSRP